MARKHKGAKVKLNPQMRVKTHLSLKDDRLVNKRHASVTISEDAEPDMSTVPITGEAFVNADEAAASRLQSYKSESGLNPAFKDFVSKDTHGAYVVHGTMYMQRGTLRTVILPSKRSCSIITFAGKGKMHEVYCLNPGDIVISLGLQQIQSDDQRGRVWSHSALCFMHGDEVFALCDAMVMNVFKSCCRRI